MTPVRIPKQYYSGFEKLLRLDDAAQQEFVAALRTVEKPTALLQSLTTMVAENLKSIPQPDLREILVVCLSVYNLRDRRKESNKDIALALAQALEGNSNVPKPDGWSAEKFVTFLERVLSANDDLNITAKAAAILTDNERIFCEARILTDIRPVFGSDIGEEPQAAVLVHMLKIAYHEGKNHQEFFVALDSNDVASLLEVLTRETSKTKVLKAYLEKHKLTYLDVVE